MTVMCCKVGLNFNSKGTHLVVTISDLRLQFSDGILLTLKLTYKISVLFRELNYSLNSFLTAQTTT